MFLLVSVVLSPQAKTLSPAPSLYPPCPLARTLGQEPSPTVGGGSHQPTAGDAHSQKRMLRGHRHQWQTDTQTDGQQGSPAPFDKVEVRVHFIRPVDGDIKL